MSIPNFPSTGLVPNVTTFQVGDILYMWDGEKWKSITAPLKADQITWKDGKTAGYALDDLDGFTDALFAEAGIVDDGQPDKLGASQRFLALISLFPRKAFDAIFSERVTAKNLQVGTKPVGGDSLKDGVIVSRTIGDNGTNCHGFSDNTEILNPTTSDGYGSVDVTTKLNFIGLMNHQFSYQDRAYMKGSGTLENWGNIIWPTASGNGHIESRKDVHIKDISAGIDGAFTGVLDSHIGIHIEDLNVATVSVGLKIDQVNGYSIYTPNTGKWYTAGKVEMFGGGAMAGDYVFASPVKFGGAANNRPPIIGVSATFEMDGVTAQGLATVDGLGALFGVLGGDYAVRFASNGALRATIGNSIDGYAFFPATTTQLLGSTDLPWAGLRLRDTVTGLTKTLTIANGVVNIS